MTYLKNLANATNLKFLAIFLMFLDHIHEMFAEMGAPLWLTMLGRLVFPIFLFLAADSFHYTRSRRKYMQRLLYMSWFMTLGNAIIGSLFQNGNIGLMNNAFSTFFVTGIYICSWDLWVEGLKTKSVKALVKGIGLFLLPIVLAVPTLVVGNILNTGTVSALQGRFLALVMMLFPNILLVEGGFIMVLLGLLFYIFRSKRWAQMLSLLAISGLVYVIAPTSVQWMMVFALIPMAFYNGQKGRGDKAFFYIFYPAHIYALYILASLWR